MSDKKHAHGATLRSDGYVQLRIEREHVDVVHKLPKEDADVVLEELAGAIEEWENTFG